MPVPFFYYFSIPDFYQRKYSRNWTKQSPKFLFFCHVHGVQRGDGEEPGRGHTMPWRKPTSGRAWLWCGPLGHPPTSPFCLYIALNAKTLKHEASIHEKFRSAAAIEDKFQGTKISVPAPCCDGELPPGAISIDSTAIFISVADSHDEEGVVLPRGWGLYR
jgi:hypothetical protein